MNIMPTEDDFVIGNYDADLNPRTNQSNPDLEKIKDLENKNSELNDKYIRLYADLTIIKKEY
jgi:molecular chaperone GrpE (heat shock protein)